MKSFVLLVLLLGSSAFAIAPSTQKALDSDLANILHTANLPPDFITFAMADVPKSVTATSSTIFTNCSNGHVLLVVQGPTREGVSAFYYGLNKLGFLFPHPRIQVSPSLSAVRSHCGQKFTWQPSLPHRGFHFETQYPNEWVSGFFQGQTKIASDTVMWLARNFQNVMEVQLLKGTLAQFAHDNAPIVQLAHSLQMQVGLSVSLAMIQQHSYHLLPFWSALTTYHSDMILHKNLALLMNAIDFDYLSLDLGMTELTPTWYGKTIHWLSLISMDLHANGRYLMTKVHASTNEYDEKYGNYNFLPQYCPPEVGILPHTVMFYGLLDETAPVYGRKNFMDMDRFIAEQAPKRKTWYYPETSYFIGMDLDVPIFLTDYLRARAQDYKHVVQIGVDGILDFTSGQELGYWLFDWNMALQASREYLGDETIGLKLLGEDPTVWKKILDFQTHYFKYKQLIAVLSTSNLFDELPFAQPVHRRILLRSLFHRESHLEYEIALLKEALHNEPSFQGVKSVELRRMLQVTSLRMQSALDIREAIEHWRDHTKRISWLNQASQIRTSASGIMHLVMADDSRYPSSFVFGESSNPTSYKYGYGWAATHLYYWEREEHIAADRITNPFFMNLYNPFSLVF